MKGLFSTGGAQDGGRVGRFHFGLMILILGAIALFCVLLLFAGFVAAMAVMIAVCSLASGEFRAKEVIALIVVLCGLCWVIFVYLLGMTIPVFPEFMVGE